jgi:hypothetical protein
VTHCCICCRISRCWIMRAGSRLLGLLDGHHGRFQVRGVRPADRQYQVLIGRNNA